MQPGNVLVIGRRRQFTVLEVPRVLELGTLPFALTAVVERVPRQNQPVVAAPSAQALVAEWRCNCGAGSTWRRRPAAGCWHCAAVNGRRDTRGYARTPEAGAPVPW